jgi:hypothetical protein
MRGRQNWCAQEAWFSGSSVSMHGSVWHGQSHVPPPLPCAQKWLVSGVVCGAELPDFIESFRVFLFEAQKLFGRGLGIFYVTAVAWAVEEFFHCCRWCEFFHCVLLVGFGSCATCATRSTDLHRFRYGFSLTGRVVSSQFSLAHVLVSVALAVFFALTKI